MTENKNIIERLADVDFSKLVGKKIKSEPLKIEQDRLQAFSFASYLSEGDVDLTVSRNNALGPNLVDGFLLLSLLVHFSFDKRIVEVEGAYGFNYGLDMVRFTSPVMVDETVYVTREVLQAEPVSSTRARVKEHIEMFKLGQDKPVMVAEWVVLQVDRRAEEASVSDI